MTAMLLRRIERFLKKTRISPTAFGREAVRDPQLVFDLRRGRKPGRRLEVRVHAFIDAQEEMMEAMRCRRR